MRLQSPDLSDFNTARKNVTSRGQLCERNSPFGSDPASSLVKAEDAQEECMEATLSYSVPSSSNRTPFSEIERSLTPASGKVQTRNWPNLQTQEQRQSSAVFPPPLNSAHLSRSSALGAFSSNRRSRVSAAVRHSALRLGSRSRKSTRFGTSSRSSVLR